MLQHLATDSVPEHNKDILSDSSGSEKSTVGPLSCMFSGGRGQNPFPWLSQPAQAARVPWSVALHRSDLCFPRHDAFPDFDPLAFLL